MSNPINKNSAGEELRETFEAGMSSERFEKNFKKYSADYQDNKSSVAGIDNDYGTKEGGATQWKGLRNIASDDSEVDTNAAGKAPRAYIPADHLLEQGVYAAFLDDGHFVASDVTVNASAGVITLVGTVPVAEMRRDAENLAMGILGAERVVNQLKVAGENP